MKHLKTSLVVAGVAATVGVVGAGGLGIAAAASNTTASSGGASSLVTKIADKFHLNKEDVQAVFDENRAEHRAEHQQKLEERLSQAVTDGKITEAQREKILAKLADVETKINALKDKTPQERHDGMKQIHEDLQQWAKDNGIRMEYLRPVMRHPHAFSGDQPPADSEAN